MNITSYDIIKIKNQMEKKEDYEIKIKFTMKNRKQIVRCGKNRVECLALEERNYYFPFAVHFPQKGSEIKISCINSRFHTVTILTFR